MSAPKIETVRFAEVVLEKREEFSSYAKNWIERTSSDPERLGLTVDLVGAMREVSPVPLLIKILDSANEAVRAKAAFALGVIGDHEASFPLIHLMEDASPHVRANPAEALGRLQSEEAMNVLAKALEDPDLSVKMNAAIALSRLGDKGKQVLSEGLTALDAQERTVATEVLEREEIYSSEKNSGGE